MLKLLSQKEMINNEPACSRHHVTLQKRIDIDI